ETLRRDAVSGPTIQARPQRKKIQDSVGASCFVSRTSAKVHCGPDARWSTYMTAKDVDRTLAALISFILIIAPSSGFHTEESRAVAGGATDSAPMNTHELQALVAPIALYPDQLVAQVLAAATFPDQVAVANYWLQQNKSLTGEALMQAVNRQSWDASVKALTQFPSVLDNMAKNLNWTSTLGEAYHNQPSEVMTAIQKLRAQAKAAGNLKSGPQITV